VRGCFLSPVMAVTRSSRLRLLHVLRPLLLSLLHRRRFKDPRYCSLVLFKCTQKADLPEEFGRCTGDSKVIGMFMNECIDSTVGHIHVLLAVLLASDDPRTRWSLHLGQRCVPGVR